MKKKYIVCGIILIIALVIVAICIWYFSPVVFLKGVGDNEIKSISVFSGSTGKQMTLTDADEINKVVSNVQSLKMRRSGFSFNYVGFSFSLTFKDKDGNVIDGLVITGKDTVRDNFFFYSTEDGELCFTYLIELTDKYCTDR